MRPNEIIYRIIGAAMNVHTALGAGLLESAYDKAVCHEFTRHRSAVSSPSARPCRLPRRQARKRVHVDFIVEARVIVEVKSVDK